MRPNSRPGTFGIGAVASIAAIVVWCPKYRRFNGKKTPIRDGRHQHRNCGLGRGCTCRTQAARTITPPPPIGSVQHTEKRRDSSGVGTYPTCDCVICAPVSQRPRQLQLTSRRGERPSKAAYSAKVAIGPRRSDAWCCCCPQRLFITTLHPNDLCLTAKEQNVMSAGANHNVTIRTHNNTHN